MVEVSPIFARQISFQASVSGENSPWRKIGFLASRLVQIETDFCVRMSVSGFLRVGVDLLAQKMESSTQRGPPYNHPQLQTTEVVGAQVAELAVCEISDEAVSSCSGTFRSERILYNFNYVASVRHSNN